MVCWGLSQLPCNAKSAVSHMATLTGKQSLTLTQKQTYEQCRGSKFATSSDCGGKLQHVERNLTDATRTCKLHTQRPSNFTFKKDSNSLVFLMYNKFLHLLSKTGVKNQVKRCKHMEGISHVSISVNLVRKGLLPKSLPLLSSCLKWEIPASAKRQEAWGMKMITRHNNLFIHSIQ